MTDIRPFAGIRYNPARVPDLNRVVTQPYDKVNEKMHAAYMTKDEHNFVRLILPQGDDKYRLSADTCRRWLADGVLKKDPAPAAYVYHEQFKHAGRELVRKAFVGCIRVEEFEKGTVLPHEFTLKKARADRDNLLRATRMDYEQIFMLYSDPGFSVDRLLAPAGAPRMQATDEYGVVHKMWAVTDPKRLAALHAEMSQKQLLIADGHHRYETALQFRQELEKANPNLDKDAACRFKLTAFVNMADPGLVILPTHRLLAGLAGFDSGRMVATLSSAFAVTPVPDEKAEAALEKDKSGHAFILYTGKGKSHLLVLKDPSLLDRYVAADKSRDYKALDVVVLHAGIIEGLLGIAREKLEAHVKYERYWNDTLNRVNSGEAQCAFFMNPTRPEQVQRLAERGERMPQKSTDFYPKLISGFVFSDARDGVKL